MSKECEPGDHVYEVMPNGRCMPCLFCGFEPDNKPEISKSLSVTDRHELIENHNENTDIEQEESGQKSGQDPLGFELLPEQWQRAISEQASLIGDLNRDVCEINEVLKQKIDRLSKAEAIADEDCRTLGMALGYGWATGAPLPGPADLTRSSLCNEAAEKLSKAEAERDALKKPFDRVDDADWSRLHASLDWSGHGKFWREVLAEIRAALHKEENK